MLPKALSLSCGPINRRIIQVEEHYLIGFNVCTKLHFTLILPTFSSLFVELYTTIESNMLFTRNVMKACRK